MNIMQEKMTKRIFISILPLPKLMAKNSTNNPTQGIKYLAIKNGVTKTDTTTPIMAVTIGILSII